MAIAKRLLLPLAVLFFGCPAYAQQIVDLIYTSELVYDQGPRQNTNTYRIYIFSNKVLLDLSWQGQEKREGLEFPRSGGQDNRTIGTSRYSAVLTISGSTFNFVYTHFLDFLTRIKTTEYRDIAITIDGATCIVNRDTVRLEDRGSFYPIKSKRILNSRCQVVKP